MTRETFTGHDGKTWATTFIVYAQRGSVQSVELTTGDRAEARQRVAALKASHVRAWFAERHERVAE